MRCASAVARSRIGSSRFQCSRASCSSGGNRCAPGASDPCSDSLVDPSGAGPRIRFQIVPEAKSVKNRIHFDLWVSGGRDVPLETRTAIVDAEAARLIAAGASQIRVLSQDGLDHYAIVLQDPEGNEFCVA
ncbi:VOC family protein [Streptomyces sp. H10-C2]|uniref:VOC family protein n=1 Tax=unclassified Streptomyces TaxID=2593676 RepID=UPI0024BB9B95|nr:MULTISPECIES: VOC family protein [unclassified Streptomyces]MDJ0342552.1 VOC family protein [Streptomyces sp. PH10-H1]MDJ0370551.1 VOC family protein [Streptomyces sp. H10-C2]